MNVGKRKLAELKLMLITHALMLSLCPNLVHSSQMVLLHKKSDEDASTGANNSFPSEVGKQSQLEKRVTSLETTVKDKDMALAKLKDELAAVRVCLKGIPMLWLHAFL